MNTSSQKYKQPSLDAADQSIQTQRMGDARLLLESLAEREKVAITLIIDCLYDVGSANLINNNLNSRSLKGISKLIAKTSKPAFKSIAWLWFSKNVPELLTEWLAEKVSFDDGETEAETQEEKKQETETEPVVKPLPQLPPSQVTDTAHFQQVTKEINMLRSQVTLLTGMLIGVVTIFGGGSLWLSYNFPIEPPIIPQSVDFLQKSSNE